MPQSSPALIESVPPLVRMPHLIGNRAAQRRSQLRSSRLRARIMHRALNVAFTSVWIVLPLLPLTAIAMSWFSGL